MELEVGSVLEGKVTGITKFGAFVSLPGGRSGLVHISEIAYSFVSNVSDHLSEGQTVKVKVISIDENHRINLSIKQTMPPPPRPERRGGAGGSGRPPRSSGDANRWDRGSRRPDVYNSSPQPKGSVDFENQLKQFMAASDSKLSELHMNERRGNRRGGRK